jgi:hypothetical protein
MYTQTHTDTQTHRHTDTHTHTYTHIPTHTHTHVPNTHTAHPPLQKEDIIIVDVRPDAAALGSIGDHNVVVPPIWDEIEARLQCK